MRYIFALNPSGPASRNHSNRVRLLLGEGKIPESVAPARRPTKKGTLLSDSNVKRWYENLRSGSAHTADVALRRLSRFCELASTDHEALVKLEQKQLEDLVQDVVRRLENENAAPDYIQGIIKGTKSWLKHNDRELKRSIKIKDQGVPVTLAEEKVPEPTQLQEVLSAGTQRAKVSASFMAFCGVRPEVLGNKDGTDGLVLGDLPDLDVDALTFRSMPAQVVVRRELSKVRHQYFTFVNEKACEYLLSYLQARRGNGEKIGLQSPVIRADEGQKIAYLKSRGKKPESFFICTANIESEVRRAIRRAGYDWRPYILRSFFDSHLLTAELQGRVTSTARALFMGHKGDIERKYTLNKRRLPKELFDMMKDQYLKGSAFLVTEQLTVREVEQKIEDVRLSESDD
jgi:hypothetical protein